MYEKNLYRGTGPSQRRQPRDTADLWLGVFLVLDNYCNYCLELWCSPR